MGLLHACCQESTCAEAKEIYRRPGFNNVAVQQVAAILDGSGWALDATIERWMARRHSRCIASQVVEDAFKRQRGQEHVRNNRPSSQNGSDPGPQ